MMSSRDSSVVPSAACWAASFGGCTGSRGNAWTIKPVMRKQLGCRVAVRVVGVTGVVRVMRVVRVIGVVGVEEVVADLLWGSSSWRVFLRTADALVRARISPEGVRSV